MSTKITSVQIDRIVNKKLSEFSLFGGGKKGKKAGEVLYEESKNSMYMIISPKARKCHDMTDSGKREKCLDKVVMEGLVILINEIDKRIDRCGTSKECIDYLLQVIISLAKYSREKYGQNIDAMATKIAQRYDYSGIAWSDKASLKIPSFVKNLLVEV